MDALIDPLACCALLLLPGAYVGFGVPDHGRGPLWRLCVSLALSPVLLFAAFLPLRAAGVPFDTAVTLLALGGLPALALVYLRRREFARIDGRTAATDLVAFAIPLLALVGPWIAAGDRTLLWGHPFIHDDVIRQLILDRGRPESPELAGLPHTYPWSGHVVYAALSSLLETPGPRLGIWLNALWLGCASWAVASLAAHLGGGRGARAAAILGLAFAPNLLGYPLMTWLPAETVSWANCFGDWRFTPWIWGFRFISSMPLGIALLALIAHTVVTRKADAATTPRSDLVVLALLTSAAGVVYPILVPASLATVGWRGVFDAVTRRPQWKRELLGIGLVLVVAVAITGVYLAWQTAARTTPTGIEPTPAARLARRAIAVLVVFGPLLAALWCAGRRRLADRDPAIWLLTLSAATSILLYAAAHVPHFQNEYKYVFTASVALAPVFGLCVGTWLAGKGRTGLALGAALTLLGLAPLVHKSASTAARDWTCPDFVADGPFYRLGPDEPLRAATDAVRDATPPDTVVVFDTTQIHLPAVTRRSLYAPPQQERIRPGIQLFSRRYLRDTQGYSEALIDARRATVDALLNGPDAGRPAALASILELGRPVAVLLDPARHAAAIRWFETTDRGTLLDATGTVVRLVPASRD